MQPGARLSYDNDESTPMKWVIIFVLLSLLAHALVFLILYLVALFLPAPKLNAAPTPDSTVSLSLQPAPPPEASVPPKKIFMPTKPQANAPHRDTLVESDNDTQLTSQSKTSRAPDSIMPDVVSPHEKPAQLENAPTVVSKETPQNPATAAPKPQDQLKPQTQTAQNPQPTPAKPTQQPPKPAPPKPPTPQVSQNQVDPDTGLPVLPPINAPTLAPQSAPNTTKATPPPSLQSIASNVQGRAGMSGAPSPDAMATELGRYKARFYQAVGSRWFPAVNNQLSLLGVGVVTVQYTIHYDGTITTKVLDGGGNMLLQTISVNSIRGCSPFLPFSDALRKQIGDDYTDQFSFSIYGG